MTQTEPTHGPNLPNSSNTNLCLHFNLTFTSSITNPTASANAYHCENPNTSAVNITHQMHRTLHFPKPQPTVSKIPKPSQPRSYKAIIPFQPVTTIFSQQPCNLLQICSSHTRPSPSLPHQINHKPSQPKPIPILNYPIAHTPPQPSASLCYGERDETDEKKRKI
jgi:hypothetical protein